MSNNTRLHVVDALRGFAIVSIMLLHNIEHFDYYYFPENLPSWILMSDKVVWETLFFLFSGKSYAIFALLFGLTYYIQTHNQEKRGNDFRARFAWRLVLLFAFGIINTAFFQGDILTLYALVGFLLIPLTKINTKVLFFIAVFLLLQPFELYSLFHLLQNPDLKVVDPESWTYFGKMHEYIESNSFTDTVIGNLTNGKKAVVLWSWENGRFFHMLALFILGMLAGRLKLFRASNKNNHLWKRVLVISSVIFIPLFIIQKSMESLIENEVIRNSLSTIETSWANMAFTLVLVSGFVLLFQTAKGFKALNLLSPIGKMSLSNYVFQSVLGSAIYYGFGFGLYKYTGATYSFIIGAVLAIVMWYCCTLWAKRYKRGPLETIWHKATWIFSK